MQNDIFNIMINVLIHTISYFYKDHLRSKVLSYPINSSVKLPFIQKLEI